MSGVTVTRTIAAICLAAAIVLRASLVVSGGQESSPSSTGPSGEEEQRRAAERLTVRLCSDCHSLAVMTAERRTASEWQDVVAEMGTRTDATAAELDTIRQFLTRSRGVVAVNTAPASEFCVVLGWSPDAAAAVVAYRTLHGRFADRDALLKVPGLEISSVERDTEALWFE
jgi:competence ComEA-like helix-hairpin-helix protein